MIKLFLAALFLTFPFVVSAKSAHASPSTILSATEHSGYTTAEAAFETHCEVNDLGQASGYYATGWIGNGWNHTTPLSFQLTARALKKLKNSISVAKSGPILASSAQCDAPTFDITARADADSQAFLLVQLPDCAPGQLNQNAEAQALRVWVANLCKIK